MADEKVIFEEEFNIMEGVEDFFVERFPAEDAEDKDDVEKSTEEDQDENDEESSDEPDENDKSDDGDGDEEKDFGEDPDSNNDIDEDDDSSPLTPYAKYLKDEGILPNLNLEEFDGSVDSLKNSMEAQIDDGINGYIDSLPDRVKNVIQNYREGVPFEKLIELDKNNLTYSSLTDEDIKNESTQKDVLIDYYKKTTRYSDERIDKELKRLDDLQEMEEEAKFALGELVGLQKEEEVLAKEAAKEAQETAKITRNRELANLQETINKTKEIVPGIKINKIIQDKLFKDMTTVVGQDNMGNAVNRLGAYRLQKPLETELILNYIFDATKEFTDWSTLAKSGKKNAIKEFEKAARQLDNKQNNKSSKRNTNITKDLMSAISEQIG